MLKYFNYQYMLHFKTLYRTVEKLDQQTKQNFCQEIVASRRLSQPNTVYLNYDLQHFIIYVHICIIFPSRAFWDVLFQWYWSSIRKISSAFDAHLAFAINGGLPCAPSCRDTSRCAIGCLGFKICSPLPITAHHKPQPTWGPPLEHSHQSQLGREGPDLPWWPLLGQLLPDGN